MIDVSLLGVFLAGLASMFIGMAWFSPKLFGTAWGAMAGVAGREEEAKKRMMGAAFFGLATMLVMAYVLAHFSLAWGVFDWIGAVELAFWVWLGFQMPINLGAVLWEMKPIKFFLITTSYQLVSLVVASVILVFV